MTITEALDEIAYLRKELQKAQETQAQMIKVQEEAVAMIEAARKALNAVESPVVL